MKWLRFYKAGSRIIESEFSCFNIKISVTFDAWFNMEGSHQIFCVIRILFTNIRYSLCSTDWAPNSTNKSNQLSYKWYLKNRSYLKMNLSLFEPWVCFSAFLICLMLWHIFIQCSKENIVHLETLFHIKNKHHKIVLLEFKLELQLK